MLLTRQSWGGDSDIATPAGISALARNLPAPSELNSSSANLIFQGVLKTPPQFSFLLNTVTPHAGKPWTRLQSTNCSMVNYSCHSNEFKLKKRAQLAGWVQPFALFITFQQRISKHCPPLPGPSAGLAKDVSGAGCPQVRMELGIGTLCLPRQS